MTLLTEPTRIVLAKSFTQWTPTLITTALWLDAADASTVTTVSGAVSQWNDKSGNSRNATQATSASRPVLTDNGLNNKPVLTFNGSEFLNFTGSHAENWSIACVANAAGGTRAIIQYGGVNVAGSIFTESSLWKARSSNVTTSDSTIGFTANSNALVSATFQETPSTLRSIYLNGTRGTQNSSATVISATNLASTIGGLSSTVYLLSGFIAEIIVSDGAWSDNTRQRTEGYLAHKWGLTANLPADHPYKVNPPAP